jgi:UPF0716 protein FxsA
VPLLLLLLFVVVPVAEIYVIIQVGQAIGALPTVLLLVADALLGSWLFRREGRRAWTALQQALAERRLPAKEVADGILVVVGGAFLLAPGFLTDLVGLLCVLPPTRAVARRLLTGLVTRRLVVVPRRGGQGQRRGQRRDQRRGQPRHDVVDGEVVQPPKDAG